MIGRLERQYQQPAGDRGIGVEDGFSGIEQPAVRRVEAGLFTPSIIGISDWLRRGSPHRPACRLCARRIRPIVPVMPTARDFATSSATCRAAWTTSPI